MRASGVTVVFASLSPPLRALLRAHGVIDRDNAAPAGDGSSGKSGRNQADNQADAGAGPGAEAGVDGLVVIDGLDAALEWCEEQILQREHLHLLAPPRSEEAGTGGHGHGHSHGDGDGSVLALKRILEDYLEIDTSAVPAAAAGTGTGASGKHLSPRARAPAAAGAAAAALPSGVDALLTPRVLTTYFQRECVDVGEVVFDVGDPADKVDDDRALPCCLRPAAATSDLCVCVLSSLALTSPLYWRRLRAPHHHLRGVPWPGVLHRARRGRDTRAAAPFRPPRPRPRPRHRQRTSPQPSQPAPAPAPATGQ